MGNTDTKLSYRQAIVELTGRNGPVEAADEQFWSQFWHENHIESIQEVFALLTAQEIRTLRDESPSNLATLCYKAVEQLVKVTDTLCNTTSQQKTVLTCVSLLTRILPYIFEEADWRKFFWSNLPSPSGSVSSLTDSTFHGATFYHAKRVPSPRPGGANFRLNEDVVDLLANMPLAQSLLLALSDLLFCPDFTVAPLDSKGTRFGAPDTPPEDLQSIDSCEYIWEAGVGCSVSSPSTAVYDQNRTELLRLLLTCFSESMYCSTQEVGTSPNQWVDFFTSAENRHALPLFTSLLNTVFAYNPNSYLPFNHLLFSDSKEPLVEVCLQILNVILDHDFSQSANRQQQDGTTTTTTTTTTVPYSTSSPKLSRSSTSTSTEALNLLGQDNLFINYITRIHREDDFEFLLKGFTRLLNNPLSQSYLPNSNKRIQFHQELLVLFWKICDYNKKFMYFTLKTCDVLKILVPILYHLNDARADRSRVGLVHIGVFIILLLSGERNFGVRLNRPYQASVPMDLPIFSGTHADLLVIVFHKLITTGHQRLQPLFDCLLTILVNVSPYLKTLSMVASAKILHLLEAFSTPWFLFSNPTNHHLVFFLLEIFNNIIQYQFDGNCSLIYTIIRKRHIFHSLANLPTDYGSIQRSLSQGGSGSSGASTSSASGSGVLRRSGSKASRKLSRPMSLIEANPHSESSYHHSHYFTSKSNPQSPLEEDRSHGSGSNDFANFDSVITASSDLSVAGGGMNLETPPSQALPANLMMHPSTSKSTGGAAGPTSLLDADLMHHHQQNSSNSLPGRQPEVNMNVTLAAVPKLDTMTEKTHPNPKSLLTNASIDEPEYEYRSEITPLSEIVKRSSGGPDYRNRQSISRQSSSASERTVSTSRTTSGQPWSPTSEWIQSWKGKLPLQTIMRMLQVR